jgi:hypothetical protein
MGLRLGTRMTVVKLRSGEVWLHSPIQPTRALEDAVQAIGPVAAIVAPNRYHHLFVSPWMAAWPDARLYAAPGLQSRWPDLPIFETLGSRAPAAWAGEIDQLMFPAAPIFDEAIFFHRASRTAILTDLIVNARLDDQSLFGQLWGRFEGAAWPKGTTPRVVRWALRDKAGAREAAGRLIDWAPQAAIIAHGEWFRNDAAAELRLRLDWLKPTRTGMV